ncbi:MAG: NblA/ycf18 family protein [Leptolyngbyaceae cyanobacterium bins.349]|nr:NblA/ycf18 family protein [Leptolyngbyaceae cyanobacterium bins.349]
MDQSMDHATELTLDQEFGLRVFADQVQQMTCEQAQKLLIEQHRLMLVQKVVYLQLLKQEWKLDVDFVAH